MSLAEVDRYLAGLAGALRGPGRVKADLLAEARHSLIDAVEAHQESGLSHGEAQRRAVAEFGSHARVVPEYQAELAVAQGRRTALLIALGLAGLHLGTPLMWWHAPWAGQAGATHVYSWLTGGFDSLSLAGAALALLVRVAYGWGSRYITDGVALTRVLGRVALAFLALHGLAGMAVYLWSVAQWPGTLRWPPIWFAAPLSAVAFGYAALCAWRCLSVTRRPPVGESVAGQSVAVSPAGGRRPAGA